MAAPSSSSSGDKGFADFCANCAKASDVAELHPFAPLQVPKVGDTVVVRSNGCIGTCTALDDGGVSPCEASTATVYAWEGRKSNFDEVATIFEEKLSRALLVGLDMEMTGVNLKEKVTAMTGLDMPEDSAQVRFERYCQVAEEYTLPQLGLTLAERDESQPNKFKLWSFNFYAAPSTWQFRCEWDALTFMRKNGLDLNEWVDEGVGMKYAAYTKEEEAQKDRAAGKPTHLGLVRIWNALLRRRQEEKPLAAVIHAPLDLFFLLRYFHPDTSLPRDQATFKAEVNKVFTCFVDTAHLHYRLCDDRAASRKHFYFEHSKRLTEFLDAARSHPERYGTTARPRFEPECAGHAYGKGAASHHAGFDSWDTVELFLRILMAFPFVVLKNVDCLDLHGSKHHLDMADAESSKFARELCSQLCPKLCIQPFIHGDEFRGEVKSVAKDASGVKKHGFIQCQDIFTIPNEEDVLSQLMLL